MFRIVALIKKYLVLLPFVAVAGHRCDCQLQATRWLKNGAPLQFPPDGRIQRLDKADKLSLAFKVCELDDAGTYSVEITEFVKNGEQDQTNCWLDVEGEF